MRTHLTVSTLALALLTACGGAGDDAPAPDATPDAASAAPAASQTEAARAAAISNALTAAPTKTDSILAAHGVTAEQLEAMMLRVARDSAAADEYRRLTTP
jgi:hypothetical protein